MRIIAACCCLFLTSSNAFLFPQPMIIKNGLVQATDAQKTTPLSIQLDIGADNTNKNDARININGIMMELSSDIANYPHPKMPGADGPHPQLSSGIRTLSLLQQGSFVSMTGRETVDTQNGCWEFIWKENAPAGTLVCGFDLVQDYRRNEAHLPKGRIYLSFSIWTQEGLRQMQAEKERVMKRTDEWTQEKHDNLAKMEQEPNLLLKALHYRNAAAALEKINFHTNPKSFDMVPTNDEIISLQDDLLLTTKGLVFTKRTKGGGFGGGDQVLLGTASAKAVIE